MPRIYIPKKQPVPGLDVTFPAGHLSIYWVAGGKGRVGGRAMPRAECRELYYRVGAELCHWDWLVPTVPHLEAWRAFAAVFERAAAPPVALPAFGLPRTTRTLPQPVPGLSFDLVRVPYKPGHTRTRLAFRVTHDATGATYTSPATYVPARVAAALAYAETLRTWDWHQAKVCDPAAWRALERLFTFL